jgi:hypothetical protein
MSAASNGGASVFSPKSCDTRFSTSSLNRRFASSPALALGASRISVCSTRNPNSTTTRARIAASDAGALK